MGVGIHAYLMHDLPQFDDRMVALSRLESATGAAVTLRDYWLSGNPRVSVQSEWKAEPIHRRPPVVQRYSGPGLLFVAVTPKVARISAGVRWSAFLTNEPLRHMHMVALRTIAEVLHAPLMAICADSREDVGDVFLGYGIFNDCVAQLRSTLGPPQPSVDLLAPDVAEGRNTDVWFLEEQRWSTRS